MCKKVIILFLLFIPFFAGFSQESKPKSTIYMKNGAVFNGEILMTTEDIIVMQTDDGRRFQFKFSEIDFIEQERKKVEKTISDEPRNFSGIIEINGGIANAPISGLNKSSQFSANLALGTRDFLGSQTFLGFGTGFDLIILKNELEDLALIPIFLQFNKTLNNNSFRPFVGLKTGYALSLNKNYKGGVLLQLTSGVNLKLTQYNSLNVGFFGKFQEASGTIIENNDYGSFTKQGSTLIFSGGVSVGYVF